MKENIAGRYQVGELIGRGGMANVYRGLDTTLDRTVAIKVLSDQYAHDPSFVTRFSHEAQAAAIAAMAVSGAVPGALFTILPRRPCARGR